MSTGIAAEMKKRKQKKKIKKTKRRDIKEKIKEEVKETQPARSAGWDGNDKNRSISN